jgi:hypothetical protein
VLVIETSEHAGLALEAGDAVGIGGERLRQNFQRDIASQFRVARTIHLSHPTGTERRNDFVGTELSTGL